MRIKLGLFLLALAGVAHAAKVPVEVITPTTNTDGTALTNLASVEIEWGTCNGTAFGTKQSSIVVPTTAPGVKLSSPIYPTGLTKVCVRAYAFNTQGAKSDASNVGAKDLLPKPGKPVTLDQPIILSFNLE